MGIKRIEQTPADGGLCGQRRRRAGQPRHHRQCQHRRPRGQRPPEGEPRLCQVRLARLAAGRHRHQQRAAAQHAPQPRQARLCRRPQLPVPHRRLLVRRTFIGERPEPPHQRLAHPPRTHHLQPGVCRGDSRTVQRPGTSHSKTSGRTSRSRRSATTPSTPPYAISASGNTPGSRWRTLPSSWSPIRVT